MLTEDDVFLRDISRQLWARGFCEAAVDVWHYSSAGHGLSVCDWLAVTFEEYCRGLGVPDGRAGQR